MTNQRVIKKTSLSKYEAPMSSPLGRLSIVCALTICALANSAQAQVAGPGTPPGAGDTLRDLQRTLPVAPHEATAVLTVPADTDAGADLQQRFHVAAIQIEGNHLVATSELRPLVDKLAGQDVTLGELRAAARTITAVYRAKGIVVARAFIPAQRIEGGIVTVTVLEGSLHSSTVDNKSKVRQDKLDAVVAAQELNGKVIRAAATDRTLLLLADLPGVGAVNGILKPGEAVGTSDLLIPVEQGKSQEGEVSVDNYGNRYTGEYRLNGRVAFNSPLHLGDRLDLRMTLTNEHLAYGRFAYDLPANDNGLRLGVDASTSHYELAKEFANLHADGHANTLGVFGSFPALRGLVANVWASGAIEERYLLDHVGSTSTDTAKNLTTATATLYGDLADALGGGAYNTWTASVVAGALNIKSPAALAIDQAAPHAQGGYFKLLGGANRLQAITSSTFVYASVAGQRASKNLDSSEKFVVGGIYGVRAYPQGEGAGDDGWQGTLELRQNLGGAIQAQAFYDAGHATYVHDKYSSGNNGETLKGYGLALSGAWKGFDTHLTVAWRDSQPAVTAPDHSPRFWGAVGWQF